MNESTTIKLFAIAWIAGIELVALGLGINGIGMGITCGIIGGIAGYHIKKK